MPYADAFCRRFRPVRNALLAGLGLLVCLSPAAGAGEPFSLTDRLAAVRGEQAALKDDGSAEPGSREQALRDAGDLTYETDDWHGFRRFRFVNADSDEWIVVPNVARADAAWVWRARFPGVATELDVELLNRGFHVIYQDVASDFGGERAMQRWRRFYEKIRLLGLAERGIFEGLSRGGLPIFAWAAKSPETVAAVVADNPVCDIRSWPGADNGATSVACMQAYGVTPETLAAFEGSPVGLAEKIAAPRGNGQAGVPVAFVLNGADEVVPLEENANVMIRKLRAGGSPVKVYLKPGLGHHPHGLQTPEEVAELADWLIKVGGLAADHGDLKANDGGEADVR